MSTEGTLSPAFRRTVPAAAIDHECKDRAGVFLLFVSFPEREKDEPEGADEPRTDASCGIIARTRATKALGVI